MHERVRFGRTGLMVSRLAFGGIPIQRLSREEGFETREIFRQVFAAMEEEAEGQQTS